MNNSFNWLTRKTLSLRATIEKYLKTDLNYLLHGSFWLGLDQLSSSGTSFLLSIAFANLLAPDTYGIYKYILSITSLLMITTLSGMDPAVTQSISRGNEGTLTEGVRTKMKWSTIGSFISICIAIYYGLHHNIIFAISFIIVAIFLPICESYDMYNSMLAGKKLFKTQALYDISRNAIILIALVCAVYFSANIYIILLVYFLTLAIPNAFLYFRTLSIHKENNTMDPGVLEYGKHLSVIYIIGTILGELDKILVFHFVGAANLAVYTLATAPTDQIKGILKNINSLALPRFSSRTAGEIRKTIWHKLIILASLTSVGIVVYIFIAPLFFKIFFPKYITSVLYSQILSISLLAAILSGFLYTVLQSQKAKKELYKYNIYSNIINFIVLIPLVYYFGIWGAVATRVVTRFFTFGLSILLVRNITD